MEDRKKEHYLESNLQQKTNGNDHKDVEANLRDDLPLKPESDEPELLATNPQKRNWRGIVLALIVIVFISSIIITASILTTPKENLDNFGETLTFDDMLHMNEWVEYLAYRVVGDKMVYLDRRGDLILLDLSTMEEYLYMSHLAVSEKNRLVTFQPSPDLQAILLSYEGTTEFRYSQHSKYDAVLLSTEANKSVTVKRIQIGPIRDALEQTYLSFVIWAPVGNHLAFVYDGHVYIHLNPFDDNNSTVIQVTENMATNNSRYGKSDWLYEEEILQTDMATWWNPTASKLAFAEFDEVNVTDYHMLYYGDEDELNGKYVRMKYPKAGDKSVNNNPTVRIHMYNIQTRERREFPRPAQIPWDGLFVFVRWYDDDHLIVGWTCRTQITGWITVISWSRNSSWIIFKTSVTSGWVDMLKQSKLEPLVDQTSQSLYLIQPREYMREEFHGIARIHVDLGGAEVRQSAQWVIAPHFEVMDILHFNGMGEFLFLATGPDSRQNHLYWGSEMGLIECLTCDNENCTYNSAHVSSSGTSFVQDCRGPGVPQYFVRYIQSGQNDTTKTIKVTSEVKRLLLSNNALRNRLDTYALPSIHFINLTIRSGTRDQLDLQGMLYFPPGLNQSHITKYPLLLVTYAGPGNRIVTTRFSLDWKLYMAATVKVIILSVDGRGSIGRGRRFEQALYKKLGTVEVDDQLDSVKAVLSTYKFINESQVGAYGWSYGGFTVGHLLGHTANDVIRCGVAVAPVSDFKLYDTAYAERFLGRMHDNPEAYLQTQISRKYKQMRSKNLLLVHGTADDNVHLVNSMSLVKSLIEGGVDVDMMLYPNDNHRIDQPASREHLYRKVITHLIDCFNRSSFRYSMDTRVREEF